MGIPKTPPQRVIAPVNEDLIEQGYDSEGLRPPWEEAEELDFDGPELNEEPLPPPVSPPVPDRQNFAQNLVSVVDVPQMVVPQLKEELNKRGCSTKGKKHELQDRLKKAIEENVPLVDKLTKEKAANLAGDVFTPGAYWELLECSGDFVEEKTQEGLRAPTVLQGEVLLARKRNYKEKFDRMVFTGKTYLPSRYSNGRLKQDKEGKYSYELRPHEHTEPNLSFIRQNKLDLDSHPAQWFAAFIPMKATDQNDFSIENLNRWTNVRAIMEDSGGLGG